MSSESSWIDFTAGWISGGISTLAIQPVDTILTRMQANVSIHQSQNIIPSTSSATLNKVAATQVSSATTTAATTAAMEVRPTSIFRGMISNFGITSLWRGSSAMIGAVPIQNAVLMTGYGYGKRWTTGSDDDDNDDAVENNSDVLLGVFMGGCVGGILQSFVMSPIELIKVSQQVIGKSGLAATSSVISGLFKPTTFTSSSNISSSSSRSSGGGRGSTTTTISAWRGLGATLLRDG
ncbi:hypothetical protein ACHAWC_005061, partial [Mediolabrus comicus]